MTKHVLVECMAASWDELGHRPPTQWRIICSCGYQERQIRGQVEALDAFSAHERQACAR